MASHPRQKNTPPASEHDIFTYFMSIHWFSRVFFHNHHRSDLFWMYSCSFAIPFILKNPKQLNPIRLSLYSLRIEMCLSNRSIKTMMNISTQTETLKVWCVEFQPHCYMQLIPAWRMRMLLVILQTNTNTCSTTSQGPTGSVSDLLSIPTYRLQSKKSTASPQTV